MAMELATTVGALTMTHAYTFLSKFFFIQLTLKDAMLWILCRVLQYLLGVLQSVQQLKLIYQRV